MIRVLSSLVAQIFLSLLLIVTLRHQEYWLGLVVFVAAQGSKIATDKYIRAHVTEGFTSVLNSTLSIVVTFLTLAAFGLAGLVSWAIILPLLVTSYLISYMGLRIGIATKSPLLADPAAEAIAVSVIIGLNLLIAAVMTNVHDILAALSTLLLVILTYLTLQRARQAYIQLQGVKP